MTPGRPASLVTCAQLLVMHLAAAPEGPCMTAAGAPSCDSKSTVGLEARLLHRYVHVSLLVWRGREGWHSLLALQSRRGTYVLLDKVGLLEKCSARQSSLTGATRCTRLRLYKILGDEAQPVSVSREMHLWEALQSVLAQIRVSFAPILQLYSNANSLT
jgi:hypothetical protein